MNRVVVLGKVSRINRINKDKTPVRFTVQVDRKATSADGKVLADYINCVMFGDKAKDLEVNEGDVVEVTGRIQTGSYQNQEGKTVYTTDVAAYSVEQATGSHNEVVETGRLTRDPMMSGDKTKVARFTLAVGRVGKDKDNTDFISCVAFGKTAEFVGNYCTKGTKLVVDGRIQTGSYTNKDGEKVYTTDVVVNELEFGESKKAASATAETDSDDDGLPFE